MGMIAVTEKALTGNGKSQQPTPEKDKEGSKEKEMPKDKDVKETPSEGANDVWRTKISQVWCCHLPDSQILGIFY